MGFGQCGSVRREGAALTVITCGTMVHVCLAAGEESEIDAEVIDLRTLLPLDLKTLCQSVEKTGRAVMVHEATLTSGFGADLEKMAGELRRRWGFAANTFQPYPCGIVMHAVIDTCLALR